MILIGSRNRLFQVAAGLVILAAGAEAHAGLYYSGEPIAELPSQWRGFLLDQRALRNIAVPPGAKTPSSPLRTQYAETAAKLEEIRKQRRLTADELADLGALYVRLGEMEKAVAVLRAAQRQHPRHFRIAANLGTAWQLQGDLEQAAACLQQATRLAPGKLQKAEELQLKLVRCRQRAPRDSQALDDLFGLHLDGVNGKYSSERKKLPADAPALAQQLALWLPADGRLLWQLAELAALYEDPKTAAAIMDGCVTEFGMRAAALLRHRQILRAAADELARQGGNGNGKAGHEVHAGLFPAKSKRPLLSHLAPANLPAISATGVNALPWSVLAETAVDRQFKPTFAPYLKELDGKQVSLSGFMQPLGDDLELGTFMLIEYPVGCWYCEMPEMTGILFVELPSGRTVSYTRGRVNVVGQLSLNATDPENFLYTIRKAKVTEAEADK